MSSNPLMRPLPSQIFFGDLDAAGRREIKVRYRRLQEKEEGGIALDSVERALKTLLVLLIIGHVVTLVNIEALVDAELEKVEEDDEDGPPYIEDENAAAAFEAAIEKRTRDRAEVRATYETAYRILMPNHPE